MTILFVIAIILGAISAIDLPVCFSTPVRGNHEYDFTGCRLVRE